MSFFIDELMKLGDRVDALEAKGIKANMVNNKINDLIEKFYIYKHISNQDDELEALDMQLKILEQAWRV